MFSFIALNDIDLDSYAYQLYDNALGTGTPVAQGRNKANVFTVSVPNTTDSEIKRYWGRVAPVNSAGVVGSYTSLISDQATPQIGDQYLASLTASKITAGTIGAHTITLNGSSSILRSSNYQAGLAGWKITGAGDAEFNNLTIRTALDIGGSDSTSFHVDVDGNMWLGAGTYGSAPFRVSNAGVMTATSGTFSGSLSSASGTFTGALSGGTIQIGSGENVFKADSNGIYLGNETFASAEFRVTPAGALTATNASVTGSISASSGNIAGININGGRLYSGVGNWANSNTGFYLDLNGYFSLKDKFYWNPDTNTVVFAGALSGASGSVGDDFSIGNSLSIGGNVRVNKSGTIGADGGQTIMLIRADSNGQNANNYPLRIINYDNTNLLLRIRYDGQFLVDQAPVVDSDIRLKKEVLESNLGLNFIKELRPVSYFMKDKKNKQYGLIAQEVKEVYEKYTDSFNGWEIDDEENKDSTQRLRYTEFISPIIKAIQELSQKVDELESRLV